MLNYWAELLKEHPEPLASRTVKSKKVESELPLTRAPQGQHNWWTKSLVGSRRTLRNWTGGRTTAKSVAQEGRKVKPIPPPTPSLFTDRKNSRTDQTSLKTAEDFFFPLISP